MGALDFDPYALLAKIQNRQPTPSTPPTLPTVGGENRKTVGTVGTIEEGRPQISKVPMRPERDGSSRNDDAETYLNHILAHGYRPYGAVSTALGWGASRAWRAEEELQRSGSTDAHARYDPPRLDY